MILKLINKEKIKGKAGDFFGNGEWKKNTLVFLGFIALAFGFWALQYFHDTFEVEVPIKVFYVNIPTGIALSDSLPQEITIRVADKGTTLLNYTIKMRKQSFFIIIDLEKVPRNKTSYVIDQTMLHPLIMENLSPTTQIKSYSFDKIEINYSPLAKKELPVAINGTISPAVGYLFSDSIRIEPAQVTVYGNKNALDTLREIQTVPILYTDIKKKWTVSADLQAPEGIRLAVDRVELNTVTEEYTEKIFELPVVCFNVPTNRKVLFLPSTVELGVKVGLSKYSQLSKSYFEIAVNYNDLKGKTTTNCSLTLTRKPPWLESYRIIPEVIEFLIEQKND